jgi:hypothetical protein
MSKLKQPIAIYYEHPHWFVPLFKELDRRKVPYVRIDAAQHHFDPAHLNGEGGYSLVFNRMSPSAYRRGHGQAIFYTLYYLDHLEQRGKRIVNGQKAFRYETSKALQLSLLETLGLPYPKSRVINHPADAVEASHGLRFPIVVKPNIGGSGAGVTKFNTRAELEVAAKAGTLDLGLDSTALCRNLFRRAADTLFASRWSAANSCMELKSTLRAKPLIFAPPISARPPEARTWPAPRAPWTRQRPA